SWFTVFSATLGSLTVFMVVLIVSIRVKDSMTLLIFGLMLGSATGGIVAVLQYFSKAEDIQVYLLWTFGSLGGVTYEKLAILAPMVIAGILIATMRIKSLNAMLLGEEYSRSLGVNIFSSRLWIIIATCIMAGAITAFCGPIAFIGIAVPHFARMLFMTSDHKRILPMSLLLGAIALLFCDIISQLPGSDEVLPINAVTAVFGAPVVIWLIIKRGNIKRSLG
ncbi:MAG: iron ABC transporter permease, partial [Cyclobacteriaceae bacterium]|nr:iron ABC transporter permease [Cyclobacteriaceae bacterium]